MNKKLIFSAMLVSLLALGLGLVGCNTGSGTPTDVNDGSLDGTWTYGVAEVIIDGSNYTTKNNGDNWGKGKVVYNGSTITFTSTHAGRNGNQWEPYVETVSGQYVLNANTMTVSGFTGQYALINDTWTRQ
jgi:predicted small secreted protein